MSEPTTPATRFTCEAYGDVDLGCFIAPAAYHCPTAEVCHANMQAERARVFRLIQEKAAAGDELGTFLAASFTSPDQLLGGPAVPAIDSEEGEPPCVT